MNKHIDWLLHIQISFAQLTIGMKFIHQGVRHKQTNTHTHSLTDWCFDREIADILLNNHETQI